MVAMIAARAHTPPKFCSTSSGNMPFVPFPLDSLHSSCTTVTSHRTPLFFDTTTAAASSTEHGTTPPDSCKAVV